MKLGCKKKRWRAECRLLGCVISHGDVQDAQSRNWLSLPRIASRVAVYGEAGCIREVSPMASAV